MSVATAATAARSCAIKLQLPAATVSRGAIIDAPAWRAAAAAHRLRILSLTGGSLAEESATKEERRAAGVQRATHPIYNFIFTYYSFDPGLLLKYSPGTDVTLRGVGVSEPHLFIGRGWNADGGSGQMDARLCKKGVRRAARAACHIMRQSSSRAPHLHCFGLHEWAMLYAPDAETAQPNKYQTLPLRLSQADLNAVVEEHPIACTHFDAYRFFTPEARPLNTITPLPTRETQAAQEQPGCVHASMDLFRYAIKLWPYVPSELLADALELAIAARVLDMRASPYDLSEWHQPPAPPGEAGGVGGAAAGFDLSPVRIETADGRKQYQREQAALTMQAQPVRKQMVHAYEAAMRAWDEVEE